MVGILAGSALAAGPDVLRPFEFNLFGTSPDRFIVALGIFAGFGGAARLLSHWHPEMTWNRGIGQLLVSTFAGLLVGLFAWDWMRQRPTLLLAMSGAAGWYGGDVVMQQLLDVIVHRIPGMRDGVDRREAP